MFSLFFSLFFIPSTINCYDFNGNILPIDNQRIVYLKYNSPNQHLERAYVSGKIGEIYPSRATHHHFQAIIDGDSVELIYNRSFGDLPELKKDMDVEACGDYITSNEPTERYNPSPDGAIIHWIHKSKNTRKHPSGFLKINNVVYGQLTN